MKVLQMIVIGLFTLALAACGAQPTGDTASSDHSQGGTAHGSQQSSSAPYDAQFIDGMTIHHQGATAMAEQALKESQRPEIKQLAQNIIATQNQEIKQMATWRAQWYPNLPPSGGTGGHMGEMDISSDTTIPFDQRFITAMISHHNGAIEMAKDAQTKAEHDEIKRLAAEIIQAQEAEVEQLRAWEKAWFAQ